MTTPNSLATPAAATISPPPVVNPLDSLAAQYDVRDIEPTPVPAATVTNKPQDNQNAPVVPVAPSAQTPKHPAWLMRQAEELSIHPLVIDRLDTASLTQFVVESLSSRRAESAAISHANTIANPNPPGQTPASVAAAAMPKPPEPQFDWGIHDEYDEYGNKTGKQMQYTDDNVNPAIAAHIKKLVKKVEELETFQSSMVKHATESNDQRVTREFDSAFSQFPQLFGQGDATAVANHPDLMQRRRVVFGAVKGMFQSMPKEMSTSMSIAEAVKTMTKSLFGIDSVAAAAAPTPSINGHGKQPDYANGHLAAPTNRLPNPKPLGEARAKDEAKAWWEAQRTEGIPGDVDTQIDEFMQ